MTREEAIEYGNDYYTDLISACCKIDEKHKEFVRMAIKALEQESVIDKIGAEIRGKYRVILKDTPKPVLDKIRAEIEEKYGGYDICEWFDDYDYEENDISEYRSVGNVSDILAIIDKYKAESEDGK